MHFFALAYQPLLCIPSGFAGTGVCEALSWKAAAASSTRTVQKPAIIPSRKSAVRITMNVVVYVINLVDSRPKAARTWVENLSPAPTP